MDEELFNAIKKMYRQLCRSKKELCYSIPNYEHSYHRHGQVHLGNKYGDIILFDTRSHKFILVD